MMQTDIDVEIRKMMKMLIKLTGKRISDISADAGVSRQNLSSYLSGTRTNSLSYDRKLEVIDCLGVRFGRLRTNVQHKWIVGDLDTLKGAIKALQLVPAEIKCSSDGMSCILYVEEQISGTEVRIEILITRPRSITQWPHLDIQELTV